MIDFKFALRQLRKSPGFTIVAVLTLALGIGVNLALYTLLDDQFLRPRPIQHPEELFEIVPANASGRPSSFNFSRPYFDAIRKYQTVFRSVISVNRINATLQLANSKERLNGAMVSANYFGFMGTRLRLGRGFLPGEDKPGAAPVAIISFRLWQEQFGGRPSVIGKSLELNGHVFDIVGVAPPGFVGLGFSAWDFWVTDSAENVFGQNSMNMFGRLCAGVSPPAAADSLEPVVREITKTLHPPGYQSGPVPVVANNNAEFVRVALLRAGSGILGPFIVYESRKTIVRLVELVGFGTLLVLLIAAANLANLLLARGLDRRRELATRVALGAPRSRLIRELAVEGLLLVTLGGLAALVLLNWYGRVAPALVPLALSFQAPLNFHPDARVVAFTLGVVLLIGIGFSLPPALAATRFDPFVALKEAHVGEGQRERRWSLRKLLVVAQVAGSLTLLSSVSLCLSAIHGELSRNLGFRPGPLIVATANLAQAGYNTNTAAAGWVTLQRRLSHLPGVQAVGLIDGPPLVGRRGELVTDRLDGHRGMEVRFPIISVGPGCFRALGIPLLEGRAVTWADFAAHRHVALVNQAFIRKYWPGQKVLGRMLGLGGPDCQIVGIVRDARLEDVRQAPLPTAFLSLEPNDDSLHLTLLIRTSGHPAALIQPIRDELKQINPHLPADSVRLLPEVMQGPLEVQRNILHLLVAIGLVALALTMLGAYGLMAYLVKQRTHEMGVRLAVGAQRADVVRLVLKRGLGLAFLGIGLGLPVAMGSTFLLRHFVSGVNPLNVGSFLAAGVAVSLAILMACWLPAYRAAKVDPITTLRSE